MLIKNLISTILFTLNTFCSMPYRTPLRYGKNTKQNEVNSFNNGTNNQNNGTNNQNNETNYIIQPIAIKANAPTITINSQTDTNINITITPNYDLGSFDTIDEIIYYYRYEYENTFKTINQTADITPPTQTTEILAYYYVKYHTLGTSNTKNSQTATKEITINTTKKLESPYYNGIQSQDSTYTTFRITNQNNVKCKLIDNITSETLATIDSATSSQNYTDITYNWQDNETTKTYELYFEYTTTSAVEPAKLKTNSNKYKTLSTTSYTNSDTTTITLTRQQKTKLTAPTITTFVNNYSYYQLKINNPNAIATLTSSTTTALNNLSVQAKNYTFKTIYWGTNETTATINNVSLIPTSDYTNSYSQSDTNTEITINRPQQTELSQPSYTINTNNFTNYKITITNPNDISVNYTINGAVQTSTIPAQGTTTIENNWATGETSKTYTIKFYIDNNPNYKESQISIDLTRTKEYLKNPILTSDTNDNTNQYSVYIKNENDIAVNYYVDNVLQTNTIQSGKTQEYIKEWQDNETETTITIKFTATDYQESTKSITITRPAQTEKTLNKPTFTTETTATTYKIVITNPNDIAVNYYIDNVLQTNTISAQGTTTINGTFNENEETKTINIKFTAENYTSSQTNVEVNALKLQNPQIETTQTETKYNINITNKNNVAVNYYYNDTLKGQIQAQQTAIIENEWGENTNTTFTIKFTAENYKSSQTTQTIEKQSITTKIENPQIEILQLEKPIKTNGEITKNGIYKYAIKNNNNFSVYASVKDYNYTTNTNNTTGTYYIPANQEIVLTGYIDTYFTEFRITTYFIAYNQQSETITTNFINEKIENGVITITNYNQQTRLITYSVKNPNNQDLIYTDNYHTTEQTILANETINLTATLSEEETTIKIHGKFINSDNTLTANFSAVKEIATITINGAVLKNKQLTIYYSNATPLTQDNSNFKWSIGLGKTRVNVDITETNGKITLNTNLDTLQSFNVYYNDQFITTFNGVQQINQPTEVIDLKDTMLTILSLPFTFYSQAFNFELFPNSAYAINIGQLLLGLIAGGFLIWLILKLVKLFK